MNKILAQHYLIKIDDPKKEAQPGNFVYESNNSNIVRGFIVKTFPNEIDVNIKK